ncbi:MAG: phosphoribosylformylglycinamidine cyclo-ligase [Desulfobulbus sp.]|nr:phosphoribosylformylglycinamidine cyclo-ligase [Desulfobulbus sp.]
MTQSSSKYSEAGVDIDKGNLFVSRIKNIVAETHGQGVLSHIGGFSGLFSLGHEQLNNPVLVASTDGVGTKLAVAKLCNKHDTIGIDLVAMCVNDIIVSGAKPLFFLDYFACNALDLEVATDVVYGITTGCKQANCSLIGGETAEMPGLYQPGDYDLAGFAVGICDGNTIIDGRSICAGDRIIGLASSGFHSNGYSLVRKVFFEELGKNVDDYIDSLGCTVGEELLRPTRIYVDSIMSVLQHFEIKGIIHITGGGFIDNIPRILPADCTARIVAGSWPVLPCFTYLQEKGNITPAEMYRTYNMGIGMMVIVSDGDAEDLERHLLDLGEQPYQIGEILSAGAGSDRQILIDGFC